MKKVIILSVVMLLVASVAMAKEIPKGDPFQVLWDAINNLEQKITNIKLTPGPKGEKGDVGDQGIQGEKGNDGDQGHQGDQGIQGEQGFQGNQGEQGLVGADGKSGLDCWDLNGSKTGDIEEDINQDGNYDTLDCKGPQGEKGEQGLQGLAGLIGETGSIGLQGAEGPKGNAGDQGIQGEKGDKGDIGPQGPIGLTGSTGVAGVIGWEKITGAASPTGSAPIAVATCPLGKKVMGGGFKASGNYGVVGIVESYPSSDTEWTVAGVSHVIGVVYSLRAYAICATVN
jgi:hypothetical protein